MRRSISLGRVRGIPIEMRLSAFILLGMLVFLIALAQGEVMGMPLGFGLLAQPLEIKLALGAVCATVIFLAILLHEVAHCITARLKGYEVRGITILIFGGEVNIREERQHDIMKGEEVIAFMGPAANLALGSLFLLISFWLKGGVTDPSQDMIVTVFSVLGFYNLLLGVFNLLPGYPFDGGLILRSFLRKRMDQERTTMTAVKVCRMSAIGIGILGFWGNDVAVILIAVLLYLTAYMEDPEFNFKTE
jgi:Zn-dependent protease